MATKITNEMISKINEAYAVTPVYAAVARQLGISPSSVKKYVTSDYIKKSEVVVKPISKDLIKSVENFTLGKESFSDPALLFLKTAEIAEMVEFWQELSI